MSAALRIIVTQGHRNTSGGDGREQSRTPALANAITEALNQAGHEAICLQNDDGSRDNWFNGSLDAVGRRVMWYHRAKAVDLLLDIHLEQDPANSSGVFAIVPDGTGLKTLTDYDGADRAVPASREYRLARAIAHGVSRATGLPLRTRAMLEPGVMSEQRTRVGGDLGWRLAMFGYTAPARQRMARIVLECGNLVADAAIIDRPGFAGRVANGVVAGIAAASGPASFPPFGTFGRLAEARMVTITAEALRVRRYAETSQEQIARLARGSELSVSGWVIGEVVEGNPVWWTAGSSSPQLAPWRLWSGGTNLAGTDVLALPTR